MRTDQKRSNMETSSIPYAIDLYVATEVSADIVDFLTGKDEDSPFDKSCNSIWNPSKSPSRLKNPSSLMYTSLAFGSYWAGYAFGRNASPARYHACNNDNQEKCLRRVHGVWLQSFCTARVISPWSIECGQLNVECSKLTKKLHHLSAKTPLPNF
jgi:hypothetical protein